MEILHSKTDIHSPEARADRAEMHRLREELRERAAVVSAGGGAAAVEKHKSRGKLLARERIDGLLDPGSPFLEVSPFAAWDMY
ncbi:MAG TPA: methylcrotonoyl-CoA carboxylase, partial [Armatimonadetes bacterium]|nr:methylcrotonoyl-CoA carboxylase [Armatimonadota bacterium]